MAQEISDMEREAADSWREWPVYVVMRLRRLQAIKERMAHRPPEETARVMAQEMLPNVTAAAATQASAATAAGASGGSAAAKPAPRETDAGFDYDEDAVATPAAPSAEFGKPIEINYGGLEYDDTEYDEIYDYGE